MFLLSQLKERCLNPSALYNFYATSEVDETSLHKACTKSVGFFAVWALETKVPIMGL
mgnify:CR=1 FL=1